MGKHIKKCMAASVMDKLREYPSIYYIVRSGSLRRKTSLLLVTLLIVGCAANYPAAWQYLPGGSSFRVWRDGNEYISSYQGKRVIVVRVGNEFVSVGSDQISNVPVDLFETKDRRLCIVANRFGFFKDKLLTYKGIGEDSEIIFRKRKNTNDTYVLKVLKYRNEQFISCAIVHADVIAGGGWANMLAMYLERLSDKYPYDSWDRSVAKDRMHYISEVMNRTDRAVQILPK